MAWPVFYLQPIVSKLLQQVNLSSIQLWLDIIKGLVISINYIVIIQIKVLFGVELDNGKHFMTINGMVTFN